MKIAIAGAFGFIGQHLIRHLLDHSQHTVVALSRSPRTDPESAIECVSADLYSSQDAVSALKNCDVGVYLVHSMAPGSRLSQGNFRDYDFILANNFARAAKQQGVRQIVYVSGMLPAKEELSEHLESRFEVEKVLRSCGVPVTTFRCGLVIGPKGSSFSIIARLSERLPLMILPQWMRTLSNPVYVGDLAAVITKSIDNQPAGHRIYDVGMDQAVTYKDIVVETTRQLKKTPKLIDVPYVSPHLSKLWVRLISGAPKALVYPLIDSVRHEMIKDPDRAIPAAWGVEMRPLSEAVKATFREPFVFQMPSLGTSIRSLSEVRSVQRFSLPPGKSAKWMADEYFNWLPVFLRPFLKTVRHGLWTEYRTRLFPLLLLSLCLDERASTEERQLYRIARGLLVGPGNKGRFEFLESHDKKFVVVALHNYRPALPWLFYIWTQAILHKIVMKRFGRLVGRTA